MENQQPQPSAPKRHPGRERWIKLTFIAAAIALVVLISAKHRAGLKIKGWGNDLDAALKLARQENRRVLAFFVSSPPSSLARDLAATTLAKGHNQQAVREGNFVPVVVTVSTALSSDELAGKYRIVELPTMLILDGQGNELNRREGFIGEVPFRKGFLDCSEVHRPSK